VIFRTLSMPNSTSDPHGKVTASATPRSMMSRTSAPRTARWCRRAASQSWAMVAWAGRIFMPLTSSGTTIFLVREWNDEGEWMKARPELDVLHLLLGIFPVPGIERHRAALASDIRNGSFSGAISGNAGLIARVDVGCQGGSMALDAWYRKYAEKEMKDVKFCLAFIHSPSRSTREPRRSLVPDDVKGMKIRPRPRHHGQLCDAARRHQRAVLGAGSRDIIERALLTPLPSRGGSLVLFGIDKVTKYHMGRRRSTSRHLPS